MTKVEMESFPKKSLDSSSAILSREKKLEKKHDADDLAHKFIFLIDLNGDEHFTKEEIY